MPPRSPPPTPRVVHKHVTTAAPPTAGRVNRATVAPFVDKGQGSVIESMAINVTMEELCPTQSRRRSASLLSTSSSRCWCVVHRSSRVVWRVIVVGDVRGIVTHSHPTCWPSHRDSCSRHHPMRNTSRRTHHTASHSTASHRTTLQGHTAGCEKERTTEKKQKAVNLGVDACDTGRRSEMVLLFYLCTGLCLMEPCPRCIQCSIELCC